MPRKEALYAVIGGVVEAVLTMVTGSFSPLRTQAERKKAVFDTITLVDSDGKIGGIMGVNEYGNGAVSKWDKNGHRLAVLGE